MSDDPAKPRMTLPARGAGVDAAAVVLGYFDARLFGPIVHALAEHQHRVAYPKLEPTVGRGPVRTSPAG